jgi:hypothetical protein
VFAVELQLHDEEDLVPRMNAMREWLDHRHIEPSKFRYEFASPEVVIRVEFRTEAEGIGVDPVKPDTRQVGKECTRAVIGSPIGSAGERCYSPPSRYRRVQEQ